MADTNFNSPFLFLVLVSVAKFFEIFSKTFLYIPYRIESVKISALYTLILIICFWYYKDSKKFRFSFLLLICSNIAEYFSNFFVIHQQVYESINIYSLLMIAISLMWTFKNRFVEGQKWTGDLKKRMLLLAVIVIIVILLFIYYGAGSRISVRSTH
jgi:hypothetical protein